MVVPMPRLAHVPTPPTAGPPAPPPHRPAAGAPGDGLDDFEPFYRAHVRRVHALCLRMSGDPRRAEELVQDVFVRAWEQRARFRGASLVGTWLHRLAVNVVLSGARADRRRMARIEPSDDPEAIGGARPGVRPEPVGERLDLERAIALLPPGARTAFVLHDVEGYTHEEIARVTGTAVATVRSQLHRARRLLMERLDR